MEPPRLTPHIRTIIKLIELRDPAKKPGQLYDKEGWFDKFTAGKESPHDQFVKEARKKQFKHVLQSEPKIKRPTK